MQRISEGQVETGASEGMSMDRSVVALAHRIELNKSDWRTAYINVLVESAISSACSVSGAIHENIPDIIESVRRSSGVLLLKAEVKDAIARLEKVGKVSNSDGGLLRIAPNEASRLAKVGSEWTSLENRVRDKWLSDLYQRYPEQVQGELEVLWTPLRQEFLSRILARNGADAYRLLSGDHAKSGAIATDGFSYGDILNKTVAGLPEKYQALARTEFPAFVRAGGDRGEYLTGLVSNAFNTLSLALPRAVLEEVYGQRKRELTLLLDTNFIFSAFGLHSNPFNEAAQDILQTIERIKDDSNGKLIIDMRCDPSTVEEFRGGLKARAQDLGGRAFDVKTATVLADNDALPGLVRSYCQRIVESGVSIAMDDFVRPYLESTERLLERRGIQVTEYKLPESGPAYEEIKNDEEEWYQIVKEKDRFHRFGPIKHDVSLWHRTRRLQPDTLVAGQTDFFARRAYLLTCDWHMISFNQRKGYQRKTEELVSILPSTFLQALTLFIPRTEDFSSALLQSLRMPIGNGDARATEDAMRRILRVIVSYEPLGEVAVAALSDRALADAIQNVENPDEIKALVDSAVARDLARTREELSLAQEQIAALSSSPPTVEHTADIDSSEMRQMHKVIDDLTTANRDQGKRIDDLTAANAEEKKRTDELAMALAAAERAKAAEVDRKKDKQATIWAFVWAIFVSALVAAACYLLLRAYVVLPWATELLRITTTMVVTLLSLYLLLRRYVSEKAAKTLDTIWKIIGAVGTIYTFLSWIFGPK